MTSNHRFPTPNRGWTSPARIGLAAGAVALAAGGAAAVVLPRTSAPGSSVGAAATLSSTSVNTGAAQAAINWADSNQGGAGLPAATVIKVEADTEKGVPVYDVRVKAPNGTIWEVTVARASLQVLGETRAEGTVAPTTPSSTPSSTPTSIPSARPSETPEAKQTPGVLNLSGGEDDHGQQQSSKDGTGSKDQGSKDQSGGNVQSSTSPTPTAKQGDSKDSSSSGQSDG